MYFRSSPTCAAMFANPQAAAELSEARRKRREDVQLREKMRAKERQAEQLAQAQSILARDMVSSQTEE